jgi:hypothetical protein
MIIFYCLTTLDIVKPLFCVNNFLLSCQFHDCYRVTIREHPNTWLILRCTFANMYGRHECQSNIQILLQDFGKDSNPESRVSLPQTSSIWEELWSWKNRSRIFDWFTCFEPSRIWDNGYLDAVCLSVHVIPGRHLLNLNPLSKKHNIALFSKMVATILIKFQKFMYTISLNKAI